MDKNLQAALEELKKEDLAVIDSSKGLDDESIQSQKDTSIAAQSAQDSLKRRQHKTQSRMTWGKVLLRMVVGGFVSSYLIVFFIGIGWLHYADTQFAVPSVIAAGIIGTYGLAKIAVSYFFTDD